MAKIQSISKRNLRQFRKDERSMLRKKFYDLWYSKIKISGDLTTQDIHYLKNQLYYRGTICVTKRVDGKILLCPYAPSSWNNEDFPVDIEYINIRQVEGIFPKSMKGINQEDCVIGFVRPCQRSIQEYVNHQIDKIVDLSVTIKINEFIQRLPLLVTVDSKDKFKMEKMVDAMWEGDIAIFASGDDLDKIQVFQGANFNIDKLRAEKEALENELKTQLGINNNNNIKKERMLVDEVNANNDEIESSSNVYLKPLEAFTKEVKEVLGFNINIEWDIPKESEFNDDNKEEDEDDE